MLDKSFIKDQEDFIINALNFNASARYFGGISSNDLSESYIKAKCSDAKWSTLYVANFTDADIARALANQMSLNPLRWGDIPKVYMGHNGVKNLLHYAAWHAEQCGGRNIHESLSCAYSKNLLSLRGNVEINLNSNKSEFKNYWALRGVFNAFKEISKTNVADFKDKKSDKRDAIILEMHKKFPKQVKPESFGFHSVPEHTPVDLFTKWNWARV
jgi:hypothetical protein